MIQPVLRLVADDLTGALDSAAELTGLCGQVPLRLTGGGEVAGSLAIDTGTREASRDARLRMATEAHAIRRLLDNNPREMSRDDILAIYRAAF